MNKIKFVGLVMALSVSAMTFAAGQVQNKVISSDYSRNSVTKVAVVYNDQWDGQVVAGINDINLGAKFDINNLQTKSIKVDGTVRTTAGEATKDLITAYVNENNLGKEIFDYILMVDNNGRFHFELLKERSLWNATDDDVKLDNASQVKTAEENGPALLANSHIIVFDAKNPKQEEKTTKKGERYTLYSANVTAYVFKIDGAEDVIGNILHNMWIYDEDDAATAAAKREAYKNVRVPMKCVAVQSVKGSSKKSIEAAVAGSYGTMLDQLERKLPDWQVKTTPESIRPYITAKIGKKEGLKNGQRFKIMKNKEVKGNLRTVKVGFARATVIANNNSVADGNTATSSFYQISGFQMKGTEFLKQSNDTKLGLSFDYSYNGLGMGANKKVFGAFSMANVTLDYLAHIHKNGISHYARINFGFDINTKDQLKKGANKNGEAWYTYSGGKNNGKAIFENGLIYLNATVGYACGLKIKQFMEIQPYVGVGVDYAMPLGFDNTVIPSLYYEVTGKSKSFKKSERKQTFAVYADPGIRFVFNCGYPFQVFLQANYSIGILEMDAYKAINGYAKKCGYGHNHGLGVGAGVKWTF